MSRRSAFTLTELLVVIVLIALLAGLLAFVMPGFRERSRAAKGGQAVQGWLNYARGRALYEQAPRGVRFMLSQNALTGGLAVATCEYLEKPDDFRSGQLQSFNGSASEFVVSKDLSAVVEPGDYLELIGVGQPRVIRQLKPSNPALPAVLDVVELLSPMPNTINVATKDFRIQRGARVAGEEAIKLPDGIIVDVAMNFKYAVVLHADQPALTDPLLPRIVVDAANVPQYFDILFAPSGQVLSYGGPKIVLWVRTERGPTEFDGNPTLVAVQVNTGSVIAVDPVPGPNPYAKIKDW